MVHNKQNFFSYAAQKELYFPDSCNPISTIEKASLLSDGAESNADSYHELKGLVSLDPKRINDRNQHRRQKLIQEKQSFHAILNKLDDKLKKSQMVFLNANKLGSINLKHDPKKVHSSTHLIKSQEDHQKTHNETRKRGADSERKSNGESYDNLADNSNENSLFNSSEHLMMNSKYNLNDLKQQQIGYDNDTGKPFSGIKRKMESKLLTNKNQKRRIEGNSLKPIENPETEFNVKLELEKAGILGNGDHKNMKSQLSRMKQNQQGGSEFTNVFSTKNNIRVDQTAPYGSNQFNNILNKFNKVDLHKKKVENSRVIACPSSYYRNLIGSSSNAKRNKTVDRDRKRDIQVNRLETDQVVGDNTAD